MYAYAHAWPLSSMPLSLLQGMSVLPVFSALRILGPRQDFARRIAGQRNNNLGARLWIPFGYYPLELERYREG